MPVSRGSELRIQIKYGTSYLELAGMQERSWQIDMGAIDASIGPEDARQAFWEASLDGAKAVTISGAVHVVNEHAERIIQDAAFTEPNVLDLRIVMPPSSRGGAGGLYGRILSGTFTVTLLGHQTSLSDLYTMDIALRSVGPLVIVSVGEAPASSTRTFSSPPQGNLTSACWAGTQLYLFGSDGSGVYHISRLSTVIGGSDGGWRRVTGELGNESVGLARLVNSETLIIARRRSAGTADFLRVPVGGPWAVAPLKAVAVRSSVLQKPHADVRLLFLFRWLNNGNYRVAQLARRASESVVHYGRISQTLTTWVNTDGITDKVLPADVSAGDSFRLATDGTVVWSGSETGRVLNAYTLSSGAAATSRNLDVPSGLPSSATILGFCVNEDGDKMALFSRLGGLLRMDTFPITGG